MREQISFSSIEYTGKKKLTRQEIFLSEMERVVPFEMMIEKIKPYYAVKGKGRPPIELEVMLRMYLVSQWYNLSDELCEDNIYNNIAIRSFVGIDLTKANAPDAKTLCRFRLLLEEYSLTQSIFDGITQQLRQQGLLLNAGTIVDATIIHAPSTTHNKDNRRDPEMSSTKKNKNYHFGCKAHIGVDKDSGFVHSVVVTTAKTADIDTATQLLHGQEQSIHGDSAYIGLEKRQDMMDMFGSQTIPQPKVHNKGKHPKDKVVLSDKVQIITSRKRKAIKSLPDSQQKTELQNIEKQKSKVRCIVEYPFRIIKCIFGFRKTNYKGLAKTESKVYMLFALTNLYFVMQKNKKSNQLITL